MAASQDTLHTGKASRCRTGAFALSSRFSDALQVDWSGWAEQDRTPMQKGAVSADKSTEVDKAVEKEEGVPAPLLIPSPFADLLSHTLQGTPERLPSVCL